MRVTASCALVLVLSACTDDGSAPTTTSPATPTATAIATTTAPPTTVAPTTGAPVWRPIRGMTFPRSEMPAAVLDGIVYVPGGFMGTAQGGAEGRTEVEGYDPATDTWEQTTPLPDPRHHPMAVTLDGRLWVLGGFGGGGPTDTVWSWSPGEEEWTTHTSMPVPVAAGGTAALDGSLFVVGGVPGGDTALRYDPVLDEWETLPPLPTRREHVAAVGHAGALWAIGGRWAGDTWSSTDRFDPATATWAPGPDLNQARGGFGATLWAGTIVVAGGEVLDSLETLTGVEVLVGGMWQDSDPMPVALHGNALASIEGRLYVLGGSRRAGAIANSGDALVREPPTDDG